MLPQRFRRYSPVGYDWAVEFVARRGRSAGGDGGCAPLSRLPRGLGGPRHQQSVAPLSVCAERILIREVCRRQLVLLWDRTARSPLLEARDRGKVAEGGMVRGV